MQSDLMKGQLTNAFPAKTFLDYSASLDASTKNLRILKQIESYPHNTL